LSGERSRSHDQAYRLIVSQRCRRWPALGPDECLRHFGSCRRSCPHDRIWSGPRRRPAVATATFRVLANGDVDADATLASAVGCPPPPRSLTPPRRPLSSQRGRAARGCGAAEIVRNRKRTEAVSARLCSLLRSLSDDGATMASRGIALVRHPPACVIPWSPKEWSSTDLSARTL
jgi:hypothetical protein